MARSARNEIVVISPLALTTSTLCPTSPSHSHSALSPSSGRTLDCVATTLEEPRVATRPSERAQPRNGEMYSVQDQNHQQRKDDSLARHVRASSDPVSRGGAVPANGIVGGLDQEPNPFEQSFSGPRHSSTGPSDFISDNDRQNPLLNAVAGPSSGIAIRRTRSISPATTRGRNDSQNGLTKLPPLSLIESPGHEMTSYGWGGIDSLRSGPLSPALLNGPAQQGMFDTHSVLRTSLTPLPGNTAFPPPSPATAALFAMMTNNTPGTAEVGMSGGGTRPHEGPNEGNHFEASFARAAEPKTSSSRRGSVASDLGRSMMQDNYMMQQQHQQGLPPPPPPQSQINIHPRSIQLNGRGGPPGGFNPSHMQQHSVPYNSALMSNTNGSRMHPQNGLPTSLSSRLPNLPSDANRSRYMQQQQQPLHHPGGGGGQNPLYLLSQASSHNNNDDAVAAAAALGNLSGPSGYSPLPMDIVPSAIIPDHLPKLPSTIGGNIGTRNRKASSPAASNSGSPGPTTAKAKKAATAAANKRKKAKDDEGEKKPAKKGKKSKAEKDFEMDDFDDPGDEGSLSPQAVNPNETDEEKRKNFLERNRQAALKCRQRKKAWLANLQSKVEFLTADNDTLHSTVTNLREEIASLRAILSAHSNCPVSVDGHRDERRGSAAGMQGSVGGQVGFPRFQ